MKKLILLIVALGVMVGCNPNKVYYEHCDSYGNCIWSDTPTSPYNLKTDVVYIIEESPENHSHSEETYVYYDDSHNHTEVIIVEDNGYDPYYYEFTNNFQEFCYGEGTAYPATTCWVEWCFDHWLGGGWYVWDEWCE